VSLDPTTTQAVQSWINSRCGTLSCSACGSAGPWTIGDLIAVPNVPTPLASAHLILSGTGATLLLPLVCSRCAHARFFSASMMGINPPPGPPPTGAAPPSP
jgi:hypothetical protein